MMDFGKWFKNVKIESSIRGGNANEVGAYIFYKMYNANIDRIAVQSEDSISRQVAGAVKELSNNKSARFNSEISNETFAFLEMAQEFKPETEMIDITPEKENLDFKKKIEEIKTDATEAPKVFSGEVASNQENSIGSSPDLKALWSHFGTTDGDPVQFVMVARNNGYSDAEISKFIKENSSNQEISDDKEGKIRKALGLEDKEYRKLPVQKSSTEIAVTGDEVFSENYRGMEIKITKVDELYHAYIDGKLAYTDRSEDGAYNRAKKGVDELIKEDYNSV